MKIQKSFSKVINVLKRAQYLLWIGMGFSFIWIKTISAQVNIIDSGFTNALGSGFSGSVGAIRLQADKKILVGGNFNLLNGQDIPDRLVRLNGDGTLDTAFNNNLGTGFGAVQASALAVQADGKILAGGDFTMLNAQDVPDCLVRFNNDGTLDTAFNNALGLGLNIQVISIELQGDGKILVGGAFTTLNGQAVPGRLIRLETNGTLDTAFTNALGSGFNANVIALTLQQDGKILVGGNFTTLNSQNVPDRFLRLNNDGTLDTIFTNALGSGFDLGVVDVKLQGDGKILVGGNFTMLNGQDVPDRLVRFNNDGTLDTIFNNVLGSGFSGGGVNVIAVQPDKKILLSGGFTMFNAQDVPDRLVRLNNDGTLDADYNNALGSGFDSVIFSMALQGDGKVLVGGLFNSLNAQNIPNLLVRLNAVGLLTNITINPLNPFILTNTTVQFFATGQYSEGQISNLTTQVNWISTIPAIASIDTNGLVTGLSVGTTTIKAILYGVSNETTLTVTNLFGGGGGGGGSNNQQVLADFNGDGQNDILLQKKTALSILSRSGSNATFSVLSLSNAISKGQKVVAANDLNGDSQPEVILKKGKNYSVMSVATNLNIGTSSYSLPSLSKGFKIRGSGRLGSNGVVVTSKGKTVEVLGNNGLKGSLNAKGYKVIGLGSINSTTVLVLVKGKNLNQASIQLNTNQLSFGNIGALGNLPKGFKAVGLGQITGTNGIDVIIQKGKEVQTLSGPTFTIPTTVGNTDKGQKVVGPR